MSWQKSYKTSIKSLKELHAYFDDSPEHLTELPSDFDENRYPIFIPIKLAKKIKKLPVHSSLWKQFIPQSNEVLADTLDALKDPIGDQVHQKTKQLIHRYPSRALFLPLTICPVHCRYCFRKNELYGDEKAFSNDFEKSVKYLQNHPEINEIIFTGGDPLLLSDQKIENYLKAFSKIEHIKFIRFHSRTPIILPDRLTSELNQIFKNYTKRFQIVLAIHINHIEEWSHELQTKLIELSKHVTLLAQTVLLKGINDNSESLITLFKQLSSSKVLPYYLHHPDKALGTQHFWLSIEEGRIIYQKLRLHLSGWMLPEYIIDIPGGHGKSQAYSPESIQSSGKVLDIHGVLREISPLDKPVQTQ